MSEDFLSLPGNRGCCPMQCSAFLALASWSLEIPLTFWSLQQLSRVWRRQFRVPQFR